MNRRPVIIDCDPGVDDAVALLLALRAPGLEVRAVTAVAGNVGLEHTCENALRIVAFAGADVPVAAGAERPLFGPQVTAADIHGADGLQGAELPRAAARPAPEPAWDLIHREALACGGELELIAIGPLTNLGAALAKYPGLPGLIRRVTIMGGAAAYGNTTPAAEFNIYADPEAAEMVFRSGIPVDMCGLDVTHLSYLTAEEVAALGRLGSPQAAFAARMIGEALAWSGRYRVPGAPQHDSCAVLYALYPELFTSVRCWVGVERSGRLTRGKTVTDAYSDAKRAPNATLVAGVDRERFVERLTALLALY